jgi:hypothetical protein
MCLMDTEKLLRDLDDAIGEADPWFNQMCDGTYGERLQTLKDLKEYLTGNKENLLWNLADFWKELS